MVLENYSSIIAGNENVRSIYGVNFRKAKIFHELAPEEKSA
jgi:hypothetical protein